MKNNPLKDPIYVEPVSRDPKSRHSRALYQCGYCGNKFIARFCEVLAGKVRSCGCLRRSRRSDHTNRVLDSWGANRTSWVGDRFLSHARLQPRARTEADSKLMKSLGIKDKDILFKAAQAVKQQSVLPTHTAVESTQKCIQAQHSRHSSGDVPSAPSAPASKQPLVGPSHRTIINVGRGGVVNVNRTEKLIREVPFQETEEAFYATQEYFNEFCQMPPEDFDLKSWIQQKQAAYLQSRLAN
jgi:hypothetical protein